MDWKWTVTAVLPVVTLVLGAMLNQWNAARLEEVQLRRERKARELEREEQRLDRREEFELTQLSDLYTALGELNDAAVIYRARLAQPPNESLQHAAGKFTEAEARVKRLGALVLNDADRQLVEDARDVTVRACLPAGIGSDAIATTISKAGYEIGRAQYAVAARIREVYKAEASSRPASADPDTHN